MTMLPHILGPRRPAVAAVAGCPLDLATEPAAPTAIRRPATTHGASRLATAHAGRFDTANLPDVMAVSA
jgi:hypothetical protein